MPAAPTAPSQPPDVREVRCKSLLCESGICDYAINCYTGCAHACVYCYARFMGRFHHPGRAWGSFVDVKVNAAEVLRGQVRRRWLVSAPTVFVSSVCDPYQPAEGQYRLTRRCLEILVGSGLAAHVQTKSALVRRDLDILRQGKDVSLCQTITTVDAGLAGVIEPGASPPAERVQALRLAAEAGIPVKAFVGPVLPELTDTPESLGAVFSALRGLPLVEVYVDRLNLRWGVWPAVARLLGRIAPAALPATRAMLFDDSRSRAYNRSLRERVLHAAAGADLKTRLNVVL